MCVLGFPERTRRGTRGRLTILMFHGVEEETLSPPCWHVLDAATFRRQLKYVRRRFQVLPLEEALERLSAGTLPDHAAVLTFDDGTRNLLTCAAPVLRDLALPASLFLTTGPMGTDDALWPDRLWLAFARTQASELDLTPLGLGAYSLRSAAHRGEAYAAAVDRLKAMSDPERVQLLESLIATLGLEVGYDPGPFRLLSWDEARSLASDYRMTLYPHSVTHPILSQCSDEIVEREIYESCAAVERETGCLPTIFAYPNGRPQDFDERAKAALRRCGVRWAVSTTEGFAGYDSDPFALPRIAIGSDLSFARFRLLVSGALEKRHNASGA
ncbi:polysaccharide deacetylase [Mycobacteriaceae bacterium 1482268.1]|nr:polysaccharide deacetylase [Mycobacteriaceae bacterium 1482268.1]